MRKVSEWSSAMSHASTAAAAKALWCATCVCVVRYPTHHPLNAFWFIAIITVVQSSSAEVGNNEVHISHPVQVNSTESFKK
jgi:hypothetical protein